MVGLEICRVYLTARLVAIANSEPVLFPLMGIEIGMEIIS